MSTWAEVDRERSEVVAAMLGAAAYYDGNPELATDETLARLWREHVAQLRAIDCPGMTPYHSNPAPVSQSV